MVDRKLTRAPAGDLATFETETFDAMVASSTACTARGAGPAVIVITEMPGISTMVLGFADRVAALG